MSRYPGTPEGLTKKIKNQKILLDISYCVMYSMTRKGVSNMDVQLKRGLLDVCVLAAIEQEDSYGYQIIKDMQPYVELSESTLYPILRRLESADCLSVRSAEHNGRLRKYYQITPQGRQRLSQFLTDWKELQAIHDFIVNRGISE